jgi:hypothetical protein
MSEPSARLFRLVPFPGASRCTPEAVESIDGLLVYRTERDLEPEQAHAIKAALQVYFPGRTVLVLGGGGELLTIEEVQLP